MRLSNYGKVNRSQQNLPQRKQTLSRLVNNTHDVEPDKFLRDFGVGGFALFSDRLLNALDGRFEKEGGRN